MASKWKGKESLLKCQRSDHILLGTLIKIYFRVAEINTVISLVLVEFVTDRFQKKFHQVDVATEAVHVVDVQDHVTVAPAQEYNNYLVE